MKTSSRLLRILICVTALAAGPASAQLGPALAGRMAQADNAAVVNNNPAGLAYVDGTQIVLDTTLAFSFSEFEVGPESNNTGGDPDTDDAPTVIPTFSASHRFSERFSAGLGVFFPAGIGSDYGRDWAGRYYATESSLVFLSIQPVLAYRVNDWLSIGGGPAIMYVDSVSESAVNNLDTGFGDGKVELDFDGADVGVVVSAMLEPREGTRFGIAYRNEQNPTLEGRAKFRNLGPLLEASLGGLVGADIDLDLNVPQSVQGGFYHRIDERFAVMGDLTWMDWSRFGRVNLSVDSNSITAKQDYNDIWIGSFGAEYTVSEDLSAGAGFTYVSSAVDSEDRSLSLPFDEMYLFGVGGRYRARSNLEIHSNLLALLSGNGRVDQQSNPRAGRLRGKSDDNYSIVLQVSLVWGTKLE
jgi:long-chain fatty acid transport protein